ncbi:MAG: monoterpene epsilon-lactone hydrolase [Paracoccaceae bacterium]|jgi:monoterpene epsilon-lactone hydrolase
MSRRKKALNFFLRYMEKPRLARESDPGKLRSVFESKARLFFRPPCDTRYENGDLGVPVQWAQVGTYIGSGVLLYFHGGGYVFGSPFTHRAMLARLAGLTGMRACLPTYRLAPEHPFPAALDDARTAYDGLLASGVPADQIVMGGDSAGGGLVLALLADICARDVPKPAAVFAFSPLTDLTFSGDSVVTNAQADVMLPASRGAEMAEMYLQGADAANPFASPLYADFCGAPDICLFAGDTEILLDDTRRMAVRLREQGVRTSEHIVKDLPHVWPIFQRLLPEADATLTDLAAWIRLRMPSSTGN